jgi:hypothetical protein
MINENEVGIARKKYINLEYKRLAKDFSIEICM